MVLTEGLANMVGDQGRDISGIEDFDDRPARKTIVQCANRGMLTVAKAHTDMERAVAAGGGKPDAFKFFSRCAVSDTSRIVKQAVPRTQADSSRP